jgi:putative flippase GtrA
MTTKLQKELFSYIIVGVFAVLIDFLFYKIFSDIFLIDISVSKRLSFVLGSIWSFIFNKFVTFKSFERKLSQVFLFVIVYFISFIFNSLSHDFFLNSMSGNNPFYISTVISILINYLGQKFIVFKKKSKF